MKIRYAITALKADGSRQLAFNNWACNHFDTEIEAETRIVEIEMANNSQRIKETLGADLKVTPVECYDNGDATRTYFDIPQAN